MASQYSEIELFDGKSYSDLLKEIYDNSVEKRGQITGLIDSLTPLVSELGDATLVVPLIKDYLEIGVKNDEQLVKLAQLVQRVEASKKASQGGNLWEEFAGMLSDSEELDKELESVQENVSLPEKVILSLPEASCQE